MAATNPVFQAPQPLVMKSYTVTLDKDEQSYAILPCLLSRVVNAKYTWYLFLGAASPNAGTGVLGDVWVTTIPGYENVYIRGERDEWNVWHKSVDYGQKRHSNDKNKFKHSYHPWLRDRLLQFNGTDLGWYTRRLYNYHRVSWNDKHSSSRAVHVEYDSLDSVTVARYVRAVHIPRPPVFGGVQPPPSSLSSGVAVYGAPPPAASRPAQPAQPPLVPAPTAGRRNAYSGSAGQQIATPRPAVQQIPAIQQPATVPKAAQPVAQNTLPPATTARPVPPRSVPPINAQSVAPSSSTSASLPPATPGQPPLRGPSSTGTAVQPTAPTSLSSVPTAVGTAPQAQPAAAPKPAPPVVVQSTTPTSTPPVRSAAAQPAQQVSSVPTDPPKYEDVVSETGVKRRRSSSPLSYASKERSPSPKRPNLGLKADGSSDTIQAAAAPSVPPATNVSQAPAPSLPSPAPAVRKSPAPAVQPSPVPTAQVSHPSTVQSRPSPASQPPPPSSVQPSSAPVVQPDPPASQPSPGRSASTQNPASTMSDAAAVSKHSQPLDTGTGSVASGNAVKDLVLQDPASTGSFLSSLPLSLAHHAAVFTEVGVTNRDHFRLLTRLPKPDLDKFLTTVRGRGLSFMESLVLRSALNGLRQPSEVVQAPGGPATIEAWLAQIGPSMAYHARVFQDLGIEFDHIPVLAQLDAETFQEFENALDTAGLTWIERFVITAKIRDGGRPEDK